MAALSEPHLRPCDPIQDRLAVLVLADLQEGRVVRGLDEIAFRIDLEDARALLADLPAENEGGGKPALLISSAAPSVLRTSRTASPTSRAARYMEETVNSVGPLSASSAATAICSLRMLTTDCVTARLPADRRTMTRSPACRHVVQLAVLSDVVDPGIGARIRGEDDAAVKP